MGGELIEDEYAGAGEQGSRQGQTLPLAPGQGLAALTHESVVAVLQGLNVLIDAGGSADPANLGVTGRRRCQAHVLGDRGSHEVDPLVHHADLLVEADRLQVGHVLSVDEDAARLRLIEAHGQLGQRRLAGARGPHDAGPLAGPGSQAHAAHGLRGGAGVGVGDVLPQDLVGDPGGQFLIAVAHLNRGGGDLPDPLSRGEGGVERPRELLDAAHGLAHPQHGRGCGR